MFRFVLVLVSTSMFFVCEGMADNAILNGFPNNNKKLYISNVIIMFILRACEMERDREDQNYEITRTLFGALQRKG